MPCACSTSSRYDLERLPEEGCSPLTSFEAGDTLLLDRWPGGYAIGDELMFRGTDGHLYLGRIATNVPDCPGKDSDDFGWIPRTDCAARVILVWPW